MRPIPNARILSLLSAVLLFASCGSRHHTQLTDEPDRILVVKSTHTLCLMKGTQVLKTYRIALGRQPIGPKERQGDHKTPEGIYSVDRKLPNSRFHLALHLSYPDASDREHARSLGVQPGGDVEIHGLPTIFSWLGSLHRRMDWTDGCMAVTNSEIEEIYPLIPVGTPVEIRP